MKIFIKTYEEIIERFNAFSGENAFIYFLPSIIMAIIGLLFVKRFAVNMPLADDWVFIDLICRMKNGSLTIIDLFKQHNEHRLILSNLIFIVNNFIKPWNLINIMYLNIVIVLLSSFVVLAIARRISGMNWFVAIFVPAVLFSFTQHFDFLHVINIQHLLAILFFLLALLSFISIKNIFIKIGLCFVFCLMSAFSSGNGLLSFIILTPLFFTLKTTNNVIVSLKQKYYYSFYWLVLSILVFNIYFIGYDRHAASPYKALLKLISPFNLFEYIFQFMGSPFQYPLSKDICLLFGILLLLIFVCLFFYTYMRHVSQLYLYMSGFGILTGVLGALSRSNLGEYPALAERYLCYSMLILMGIGLTVRQVIPSKKRSLFDTLTIILVVLISLSAIPYAKQNQKRFLRAQKAFILVLNKHDYRQSKSIWHKTDVFRRIVDDCNRSGVDLRGFTQVK